MNSFPFDNNFSESSDEVGNDALEGMVNNDNHINNNNLRVKKDMFSEDYVHTGTGEQTITPSLSTVVINASYRLWQVNGVFVEPKGSEKVDLGTKRLKLRLGAGLNSGNMNNNEVAIDTTSEQLKFMIGGTVFSVNAVQIA